MEYTEEELKKLRAVDDAFRDLEGIKIPFNLICQHFAPLQKWLNKILRGDEKDDLVEKILKKKRGQYSESLASTIEIESFEDVIQHLGNMLHGMETTDASSVDDEIAVDVALGIINMVKELI